MSEFPQSRSEAILQATINGDEYTDYPQSRIEELLIELKAVIEAGGGGGGTTNYNLLENKPQINGETLTGDKSSASLGLTALTRFVDAEKMVCAEFFDQTKAYDVDEYVIYNDGLYKFTSAHVADTAWDDNIVDQIDLVSLIESVIKTVDVIYNRTSYPSSSSGSGQKRSYSLPLGKSFDDYDAIYVQAWTYWNKDSGHESSAGILVFKSDYYAKPTTSPNQPWSFIIDGSFGNQSRNLYFTLTSSTTLTTEAESTESGNEPILYKIHGLKFGTAAAGGGTTDYEQLQNLPQINGHTLTGDQSASDLGLENPLTQEQLDALLALIPD